jgi:hypothetical protein
MAATSARGVTTRATRAGGRSRPAVRPTGYGGANRRGLQAFLTASLMRFCQALKRTAASLRFS